MKIQYKKECKISDYVFESAHKAVIEKRFILDFFEGLPVEDLKRLISYKEINHKDKSLWLKDIETRRKLEELMNERVVLLEANIWLDNGVEY